MKKILELISKSFLFLIVILFISCNSSRKGKWSDEDKERFISEVSSVKDIESFGSNKQKWIDCYLQKCEANYECFDDANNDENGVEKIAMQCSNEVLSNGSTKGKWSEVDKKSFRDEMNSIQEVKDLGEYKNMWVDCYLSKCEAKYGSYYEANQDSAGCTKIAYECNELISDPNE